MEVSDAKLAEFQELYLAECGRCLSPEEAREMVQRLLALYEVMLRKERAL